MAGRDLSTAHAVWAGLPVLANALLLGTSSLPLLLAGVGWLDTLYKGILLEIDRKNKTKTTKG